VTVYKKMLRDMMDSQRPSGMAPTRTGSRGARSPCAAP
jgi:hypothetical protein